MDPFRERLYRRTTDTLHSEASDTPSARFRPRAAHLRFMIKRHFPSRQDARVLDLGCGHGALIHYARQLGYRNVRGIDGSPTQVLAARTLGIDGVVEGELLPTLRSLPPASLEVVLAFDVMEHLSKTDLLPVVDEVLRVLAPEGRWIIHAPNGDSPFVGAIRYGDLTHENAFTRLSLRHLLLASGYSRVDCFESGPLPVTLLGFARFLGWRAIHLALRLWLAVETGDVGREAIFTRNFLAVAFK